LPSQLPQSAIASHHAMFTARFHIEEEILPFSSSFLSSLQLFLSTKSDGLTTKTNRILLLYKLSTKRHILHFTRQCGDVFPMAADNFSRICKFELNVFLSKKVLILFFIELFKRTGDTFDR